MMLYLFLFFINVLHVRAQSKCRDPWLRPFISTSIWNTPIGTGAQFYPAGLFTGTSSTPSAFKVYGDIMYAIKTTATDPVIPFYAQSSWCNSDPLCNHCTPNAGNPIRTYLIYPQNFKTLSIGGNFGAVILQPDGQTLIQMLQMYRCTLSSPLIGIPMMNSNILTSDGIAGSHGGSYMSALGGAIRLRELLPSTENITHALDLEVNALYYYSREYCKRWPATKCDGYYKTGYNGTNKYMGMGTLLAIPLSVSTKLKLSTVPAKKLLHALTYYGGYITDDAHQNVAQIGIEYEAFLEFHQFYGYTFSAQNDITKNEADKYYDYTYNSQSIKGRLFYRDIVILFKALQVVINNGPTSIGGGGVPLAPAPLPLCTSVPTAKPTSIMPSVVPSIMPSIMPSIVPSVVPSDVPSSVVPLTIPLTTVPSFTPSTVVPLTVVPSIVVPLTVVPLTVVPSTVVPSSVVPSSVVPSTVVPSTVVPSITPLRSVPSSVVPSIVVSSTVIPSTTMPSITPLRSVRSTSSVVPSSVVPSSVVLSTVVPSTLTVMPSIIQSFSPSTIVPSTIIPSTVAQRPSIMPSITSSLFIFRSPSIVPSSSPIVPSSPSIVPLPSIVPSPSVQPTINPTPFIAVGSIMLLFFGTGFMIAVYELYDSRRRQFTMFASKKYDIAQEQQSHRDNKGFYEFDIVDDEKSTTSNSNKKRNIYKVPLILNDANK